MKPKNLKVDSVRRFMEELTDGAGKILLKYYHKKHTIEKKEGAGIVTEADKASEAFLIRTILKKYPKSHIFTEETGLHPGTTDLKWIMDPLDGTSNYAHGFPWFCISIALHYQEKPLAGCIYHPIFGERFFAFRGKGSFLNRKKIRVSKITKLEDSLLGTGFYYSVGKSLEDELKIFGRIQSKALGVRRPGSAALDLAYVACGRYDGFWERGLAPWDVAAGSLIVEEAGGRVTGYQGQPTYLEESEIVATNGALHKKILALI